MRLPSKRTTYVFASISILVIMLRYQCYIRSGSHIPFLQKDMKYILIWTNPNHQPLAFWGHGQEKFIKRNCSFKNCYVTADRFLLPSVADFDAILFHTCELPENISGPDVRSPHQKYVFVSMESSHYYPVPNKTYDGYFNWTLTYRLNSDGYYGYITVRNVTGHIIGPKKSVHWMKLHSMRPIDNETKKHLENKKKAAAWFVSNCRSLSKREWFYYHLQRELNYFNLDIDVFGECELASEKCPRSRERECFKKIQEDYYFYLSMENSFSVDYVTEKLLNALQNYAVPIVYGSADYTRFMPDGIYLHGGKMDAFDLAKQMNDIIKDKNRYYNFFKWRNHYSYHHQYKAPDSDGQCRICEMLHDETLVNKKTVYTDITGWWNTPET